MTDPDAVPALIKRLKSDGYDQVKVYHTLSPAVYRAVLAAAAHERLKVVGHVPFFVGIEAALAGGQYSIEHLRGYDFDGLDPITLDSNGGRSPERVGSLRTMSSVRMAELAAKTARIGVWNVPTIVVNMSLSMPERRAAVANDPNYPLLSPITQATIRPSPVDAIYPPATKAAVVATLPADRALVKALYDARAGLLIGTDTELPYLLHGFTAIDEMEEFVAAGIPKDDVLKIATVSPAKFLGMERESGTVTVGKRTDLILLAADPAKNIANLWQLEGVLRAGRWHERTALLREIRRLRAELGPQ